VLALVVLAATLANLEVGLVNVALPTLAAFFQVSAALIQWLALTYQLALIGTLVLFGRLVDLLGGRTLYLVGMATFVAGSTLAMLGTNALWLIAARGLLGLGAAMLLATGQALLTLAYPIERRGRALGFIHMAVAVGLMAGPAIGGVVLTTLGWRAIFLTPLPLAVMAFAWGWKALPKSERRNHESLDLLGALLIFTTASFAALGLTRMAQAGWGDAIWPLVLAFMTGVAFLWVERRQADPLVDLRLLSRWNVSAGLLAALLTFIALASNMFLIPFTLQTVMSHSTTVAGVLMMVAPLSILPVAPLAGALADRIGSWLPTALGLMSILVSIIGMAQFEAMTPLWFVVAILMLYGIGAGLFQAPNNSAVLSAAPQERVGTASGMLALSRNLGQVIGIAVASMVWTLRQAHYEQLGELPSDIAVAAGMRDAFLVLAGFGLFALIVVGLRRPHKRLGGNG
jgi:EmrB/QacA subfamily drug resistance transporter